MLHDEEIIQLGEADAIPIAGHVVQAIRTGLPLESGLRALAEQTRSRTTREALLLLGKNLEQGMSLADALQESNAGLPRSMQALVQAGLETGRLDSVMQYCVEQSQRAISLRQQIWISLSYPMFLVWFAMVICGGVLLRVAQPFGKIFDDFGTELPGLTLALMTVSSTMNQLGWLPWVVIALSGPATVLIVLFFGVTRWGRRWSTTIPWIGRVFRFAALSELCRLLSLLVESGLGLPKALRFAANASDDHWLSQKCRAVADDLDQGSTPSSAVAIAHLPNSLGQVFRATKSERTFAEALRGLSDIYAAQCLVGSQMVNSVVGPVAVIVVVSFVGTTALALFLPLIKLLNDLA